MSEETYTFTGKFDPAAETQPVTIRIDKPDVFTVELTEAAAKALRSDLESLVVRNMIAKHHSSLLLADTALAHFGLRFEHGFFIPEGHYLDLVHSQIVPDGQYIHPLSKEIVDVPEGRTYDRTKAQLMGV